MNKREKYVWDVSFVELDCGHYIFRYESERIAEEIKAFLQNLD